MRNLFFFISISFLFSSCSNEKTQTISFNFKKMNVLMELPETFYYQNPLENSFDNQNYLSSFNDSVNHRTLGFFIGPNVSFSESDLKYFEGMLPLLYARRNYEAIEVKYGNKNWVSYFKANCLLTDLNTYKEVYIVSTLSSSFSMGIVCEFKDENFSLEKYVNTIKISKK